jgi:protein-glucosylgalactosylhydroxylysine glucosidase
VACGQAEAANYIRQNPHRIHLATVGWHITKADGTKVAVSDIQNIDQTLDPWKGEITSHFTVEGTTVEVVSVMSQTEDRLVVQVKSGLLREGRLGITINYPYPTDQFQDEAVLFDANEPSRLQTSQPDPMQVTIRRQLDTTRYFTQLRSSVEIPVVTPTDRGFVLKPADSDSTWSFDITFSQQEKSVTKETFEGLRKKANTDLADFWNSGMMIDFGGTEDSRAVEIERRMVLSLYLTKINCGGKTPPQETGLTYNSWYGKPHMEMAWWHGVHYAMWGRPEVLESHMDWYLRSIGVARQIAERQGFEGVRWQKMTDPWGGETASSVGSYLLWQQPHIITFAELIYGGSPTKEVLEKYDEVVQETAAFMADFAWYDPELKRYILGPGVIAAQERFDPKTTFNPTYELAYWRWALEAAQQWRERQGQPRNEKWDEVLKGLSPLPQLDGLYLAAESAPESYDSLYYMTDHPSVLGAYGMLPATKGLDTAVMHRTFNKIWADWQWHDTWGWDFPMVAMTATRLGDAEKAVDGLLMPITTNIYLPNGHNYQTDRLRLYLPGNGGVLAALAMMAKQENGWPEGWVVRVEQGE